MNLPAGVAGAIVSVADYGATFQTNNLTVVPNGTDKIGSTNENATLNVKGQSLQVMIKFILLQVQELLQYVQLQVIQQIIKFHI